jgi:uncharacterized protein
MMDFGQIARDLGLREPQVRRVVELLDDGNTVPFITRFRKDQTGALDEEQIRKIQDRGEKSRTIAERRQTVRRSIELQDKLTDELAAAIDGAKTLKVLEDIYLPYKPRKRSLASVARENGLGPLAEQMLTGAITGDLQDAAQPFVNPESEVTSVDDVWQGVSHIIAERFAENADLRDAIRRLIWKEGRLCTQKLDLPDELNDHEDEDDSSLEETPAEEAATEEAATEEAGTTEAVTEEVETEEAGTTEAVTEEVETEEAGTTEAVTEEVETEEAGTTEAVTTEAVTEEAGTTEAVTEEVETEEAVTEEAVTEEAVTTDQVETTEAVTEEVETEEAVTEEAVTTDQVETTEAVTEEVETEEAVTEEAVRKEKVETEEVVTEEAVTEAAVTEAVVTEEIVTEDVVAKEAVTEEVVAATEKTATGPTSSSRSSKEEVRELRRRARREKRHKKRQKLISAFKDYFDFSEKISKIPPHRVLAINRGDRSRVLRVKLELDPTPLQEQAEGILIPADHPQREFLNRCLRDALHRLATPSIDREVRRELNEQAESRGVSVFVRNLRNLLLQPPVPQRRILAIDPGYRSGCKLAMLDECGNVLAHDVVCIVGKTADVPGAKKRIADWVQQYDASVIAIGNGAACRDTEQLISNLLANELKDRETAYAITNEAGASVYSTSSIGREELPDLDPVTRSAVSIGRRLLDPLSELVKINPANIGVGLYQHDVKAKHLRDSLDAVVESCVNFVGVDVNTASPALLCYVSGLNQLSARRIYEHRLEHGPFASRAELLNVSGVGEASYVQAAGFLRVVGGENPLDGTWIHPESYEIATRVLEKLGVGVGESIGEVDVPAMAIELDVGEHLLADILAALVRPGHDPRQDLPAPIFRRGIVKLEDLEPGMELDGTVLNVVDFGAFVDIGLSDSGLVHISRLANQYIKDPHDVVSVGDVLKVWVVDVDQKRRRVSLTAIQPGTERSPRPPRGKGRKPGTQNGQSTGNTSQGRQDKRSSQQPSRGRRQRFQKSNPPPPKHKSREFVQKKKNAPAITEEMAEGSEPMRSFSDLAQFFETKPDDDK